MCSDTFQGDFFADALLEQRGACVHVAAVPHLLSNAPVGSHFRAVAEGRDTTLVLDGRPTSAGERVGKRMDAVSEGLKLLDVTDTRAIVWVQHAALPVLVTRQLVRTSKPADDTNVQVSSTGRAGIFIIAAVTVS